MAALTLKDYRKAGGLRLIFEAQDGLCAYSNAELIPGINASIDHKVPPSRGGTHDLENIHWITKDMNRMKGNMTHDEFVSLCEMVVSKHT